ncbi:MULTISPECIES: TetR/AcrR family transcriptional regulator [unclassified Beijerinckia]|uniref:TetR/AcrR family transcriptional regulator n=1 Tax=unclassified Beijerinckia TaxID=2638183 RepID=UPI00089B91F3|nr:MULTISPECIES: TetR/AcrR family transcriptional regulator [unclassified Beijerinckia]MDH7795145.1 TetR/AcrR family transcriptional repressor of uid operon [Beijerinckia sp. GAS462]SEB89463.1 transcriptional regulator, TetR family [Beijerinckia sp. 28-YEA-48]
MARPLNLEDHQARRQAILEAAKACFGRKGFHQTTTAEICAEAGISTGNLFHYFRSKKAIIAAIVEQQGDETKSHLEGLASAGDLYGALHGFFDFVIALAGEPDFANLALEIAAEASRDPEIGALVRQNDALLREGLTVLASEAIRRQQIAPGLDAAEVALGIAALIDGLFARVAIDPMFNAQGQRNTFLLMLERFLQPKAK